MVIKEMQINKYPIEYVYSYSIENSTPIPKKTVYDDDSAYLDSVDWENYEDKLKKLDDEINNLSQEADKY
jgi:hypothetical protein